MSTQQNDDVKAKVIQLRKMFNTVNYRFKPAKDGDKVDFKVQYFGHVSGEFPLQGVRATCGCFKELAANSKSGDIWGKCVVNAKPDRDLYRVNGKLYQLFIQGDKKLYSDIETQARMYFSEDTVVEQVKAGFFSKSVHVYFDDNEELLVANDDLQIEDNPAKHRTTFQVSGYILP